MSQLVAGARAAGVHEFGRAWDRLVGVLSLSGGFLGPSGVDPGPVWGVQEGSWARLGRVLGLLGEKGGTRGGERRQMSIFGSSFRGVWSVPETVLRGKVERREEKRGAEKKEEEKSEKVKMSIWVRKTLVR